MNSTNYPDLYRLLSQMPRTQMADGGLVLGAGPGSGLADWYQQMYGPVGVQQTNAVDPFAAPIYGPGGEMMGYNMPGGPGAPGQSGTGSQSGPTAGVAAGNATAQAAQQAIAAIASVMGVPGIGLMSQAPAIANMLGLVSSIAAPGIGTVDVNEPNPNVNDVIAAIDAQTQAAAQDPSVSPVGVASGPTANPGTGPTAGNNDGPGNSSGTDANGNWARGGLIHAKGKPRQKVVRRGALANVR